MVKRKQDALLFCILSFFGLPALLFGRSIGSHVAIHLAALGASSRAARRDPFAALLIESGVASVRHWTCLAPEDEAAVEAASDGPSRPASRPAVRPAGRPAVRPAGRLAGRPACQLADLPAGLPGPANLSDNSKLSPDNYYGNESTVSCCLSDIYA